MKHYVQIIYLFRSDYRVWFNIITIYKLNGKFFYQATRQFTQALLLPPNQGSYSIIKLTVQVNLTLPRQNARQLGF